MAARVPSTAAPAASRRAGVGHQRVTLKCCSCRRSSLVSAAYPTTRASMSGAGGSVSTEPDDDAPGMAASSAAATSAGL